MCSRILATRELSQKHTGENIRTAVDEILEEFDALRPGNTYVTDNAANMKAAMKERSWLGCAGHNLNLVLAHSLKASGDEQSEMEKQTEEDCVGEPSQAQLMNEVWQLIAVCKGIVAHVKRSRIQAKLPTTLKQAVSTRWNSILTMLKSILSNSDDLKKLADEFGDKKLQRSLLDVNVELLKQTVSVLEHFDAATRTLSADLRPSLHLVYPTKVQLKKHLLAKDGDGPVIRQLKLQLTNKVDALFHVKPLHRVATLLDPRLKIGLLSAEERDDAMFAVQSMMSEVEVVASSTDTDNATASATSQPPAKKMKVSTENAFLADLFCTSSTPAAAHDELASYLTSTECVPDVLSFWHGKEDMWPKLSMCAKWVLATPATSTSSERVFSVAGRTLDDRRSQLNPETVDRLLFLHGLPDTSKQ